MNAKWFFLSLAAAMFCFGLSVTEADAQGVGINTSGNSPDPSALLDVNAYPDNNRGFLLPRLTTAERNAIPSPAIGLQIFNIDCENINIYLSGGWEPVHQSHLIPSSTTAGVHVPSATQIVWNWNAVMGATGYKYNTTNNYYTAVDNGTSLTHTQTGLNPDTEYTLYVWSYNDCSNSSPIALSQGTLLLCGTNSVTFIYNGVEVTYGTVQGQNGTCWLDRNLGASRVATAYNDSQSYGDFLQWGRLDDGHQGRTSTLVNVISSTDVPGHSNFINGTTPGHLQYDWRNPHNDNLWQGESGINNPCPPNWRIPTETELENERLSWGTNNRAGAYASPLKFSSGGRRQEEGSITEVGTAGMYYCSNVSGGSARFLYFDGSTAYAASDSRSIGRSVRCILD